MTTLREAFEKGEGFYEVSDVAFYAKMHPNTVRSWFFNRNRPILRGSTSTYDDNLLSYDDLIEAIYVRKLRQEYGIQFSVIHSAIETARNLKGAVLPFAHPDFRTVVIGKEINIIENDKPNTLIALAPNSRQTSNREILEKFITDLEFDDEQRVIKHIAYKTQSERVVIARDYNFGVPMLESCGYPVEVLWNANQVEGGVRGAAQAYGVDEITVKVAVKYYDEMLKAA